MSVVRLSATVAFALVVGSPTGAVEAQTRQRIMYFATATPAGTPTSRPYSNCERVEIRGRLLWACPTSAVGASGRDRSESSRSRRTDGGTGGSTGGGMGGGGTGGSTGGGGMGGTSGGGMP